MALLTGVSLAVPEPDGRYVPGVRASLALARRPSNDGSSSALSSLVEEWSQCVKRVTASSRESAVSKLFDGTNSYWQSCGTQGKVPIEPT